MEYFFHFFMGLTKDPVYGRWLASGMLALAVFIFCIAAYFLFFGLFNPVRKRLFEVTGRSANKKHNINQSLVTLGSTFTKDGEKQSYNQKRLIYAGFHGQNNLSLFFGIRILLMILFPVLAFFITVQFFDINPKNIGIIAIIAVTFAYMIPSVFLDKAVAKRQRMVRNGFPDVIDQLIVCTEAGLGIEAGLQRVGKNTEISNSVMGYELSLVNAELRAGIDRQVAFNNLVLRTGIEEIKGFVSALAQSVRFGTSIAETMRVYAEDLRDKRMQKAEEEAAKIGVKMMFPLVFCFFPGIFVVILAPAVIIIVTKLLV